MADGQTATETRRFRNRAEAGRALAQRLQGYAGRDDVIVLGLPRGGVPVAYEVARELGAPLDVYLVRKLGVPGHDEYAFGAIATGGVRVLNKELIERLGLPAEWIEAIDAKERRELERQERAYRGEQPPPDLAGRTVILVDDGLATGSTMLAALQAVRLDEPAKVIAAAPVAAPEVCEALGAVADEVVCAVTPRPFRAVGLWYEDFSETSDEEVRELLASARRPPLSSGIEADGALRALAGEDDYQPLIERAYGVRHVLIGEASHGTHEFYRERAELTKALIAEAGCTAVAVEADWPDAYRVNRFVRGAGEDRTPEQALRGFRRFPVWMWRNTVVAEFVGWLREFNDSLPAGATKVGFYGLDLYSLHASMDAVTSYLDRVDPEAASRARERYACFDQFGRDPQVYAYEAGVAGAESCEEQAVAQLVEMRGRAAELTDRGREAEPDELFFAEQNARLVVNAERYYRAMFRGGVESWNLRDRHMAETLEELTGHLERTSGQAKVALWEHNSHLGDNRATEIGQSGQLNVGQLVREKYGKAALLLGFTTYTGTVTAASQWGGAAERKSVRPALPGSWEQLFHEQDADAFLLDPSRVHGRRLERAIGVIYQPETERISHYFHARLAEQFDAVIHIDQTTALEPLERTSEWEAGELPETFPTGI
ncbi:MAG TPA: erythromycin esterase family protein [Solirubrobacteraceae bacterium]|jgi:erythromycin esterase-like protein/predicted phosphoribosyltransferase|nr:erythromycin esterase family protein [Solirubrobacteraceae bacterium]